MSRMATYFRSYRSLIIAVMLTLSALPAIIIGGILIGTLLNDAKRNALSQLDLKATQMSQFVESSVTTVGARLATLADNADVIYGIESSFFGAQAADLMTRFKAGNPLVDRVSLVNLSGTTVESVPTSSRSPDWVRVLSSVFADPEMTTASGSWQPYVLKSSQPVFAIVVPLRARRAQGAEHGRSVGFIIAEIPLDHLRPRLWEIAGRDLQVEIRSSSQLVELSGAVFPSSARSIEIERPVIIKVDERFIYDTISIILRVTTDNVEDPIRSLATRLTFAMVGFIAIVAFIALVIARRMGLFIQHMRTMVEAYSHGDYSYEMPPSGFVEFNRLATLLKRMRAEIIRQIEDIKIKSRLDAELDAARSVQRALFPPSVSCPGLDFDFRFCAASQTSGDWLGYFYNSKSHRLQIFIADVTGHGMSAALMSGVGCGAVYSHEFLAELQHLDPTDWRAHLKRCAQSINSVFTLTGARNKMVSMSIMSLDLMSGHLAVLNAGHPPPWVLGAQGIHVPASRGPMLGFDRDSVYTIGETVLKPGDILFAYTDGLTSNTGTGKQRLSPRVVEKTLRMNGSASDKLDQLIHNGQKIWGESSLADDVTVFLLHWTGAVSVDAAREWANSASISKAAS